MGYRRLFVVLLALLVPAVAGAQERPGEAPAANAAVEDLPPALARVDPAWRDFEPEWRPEPCPFAAREDFDKERIECGYVLVPENRRDPDSRLIRLSVARVASEVESPPAGTTVYLRGGPGQPGVGGAPGLGDSDTWWAREWGAATHLVLVDQRATGASGPFICRDVYRDLVGERPFSRAARQRMLADLQRCFEEGERRGMDLGAYTTWDNAMDIRDLRRALDLEAWNLFGVSYGTELAQMVMRVDPAGVRSAVLDSVVAPSGWEVYSRGLARSLEKLDAVCRRQPACVERFGDLQALARRAAENYANEPLVLDGIDPYIHPDRRFAFTDRVVAFGLFRAFYTASLYPALPAVIEAFAQRDERMVRVFVEAAALRLREDFGVLLHVTASCGGWGQAAPEARRSARANAPYWSRLLHDDQWTRLCPELGLDPDPLHGPVDTDLPTLLIVGDLDPITLPEDARAAMQAMSDAHLAILPFLGHGPTRTNRCASGIATEFLAEPSRPPGMDCIERIAPPDLVTEYKPTAGAYRLALDLRSGNYASLSWGALPAVALFGALLAFPLAALGRRIDGRGVSARRPRLLAWLAAVTGLGGLALLVVAFVQTVSTSGVLIPLGLIGPTGWAGAALVLALVAAAAALWSLRGSERILGTTVGVVLTALSVALVFAFAVQRGLVF